MNNLDLPPFPTPGASGPGDCEAVCLYLGIVDELSFEQVRILSEHVKECEECAAEFQILQRTTRMLASLPESIPSARVDDAIHAFLRNQPQFQRPSLQAHAETPPVSPARPVRPSSHRTRARSSRRRAGGMLALAAAILLVMGLAGVFLRGIIWPATNTSAFALPTRLTWNGYVLHYMLTKNDARGKAYQVEVYQDLGTNQMHIESLMKGTFDVVVVTDQQNMLGKDMMHHVAQTGQGVANWAIDGSVFDLEQVRQDLNTRHALYLGKSTFQHQEVYQIRTSNGQILLLNMQYLPANALGTSANAAAPLYSVCELMPTAQVSDSMWDMQVPSNFRMGELPVES